MIPQILPCRIADGFQIVNKIEGIYEELTVTRCHSLAHNALTSQNLQISYMNLYLMYFNGQTAPR